MAKEVTEIDAEKLATKVTIRVIVHRRRRAAWRTRVGMWLLDLASRVMPQTIEIEVEPWAQ